MKNTEGRTYMDLAEFLKLKDFFDPKYITPEILEILVRDYQEHPVWHMPDPNFKIPSKQELPKDYQVYTVCLSCKRVYEISFQSPPCTFPGKKEQGPYCYPCILRKVREKFRK